MISGVSPISSSSIKPMNFSQIGDPPTVSQFSPQPSSVSAAGIPSSIDAMSTEFEKMMVVGSGSESTPNTQPPVLSATGDALSTKEVPAVGDKSSKTEKLTADDDLNKNSKEFLEKIKKELSPESFAALKEVWVGKNGSDLEFAQSYLLFFNTVVNQNIEMYNFLKDNLETS